MSIDNVELTTTSPIINGSIGEWGQKLNAITELTEEKLNEIIGDLNFITGINAVWKVVSVANFSELPLVGEVYTVYYVSSTNVRYMWSNGEYINVSTFGSVTTVNGETGDVVITKSKVGLGSADDTSDLTKINTNTYSALNTTSKTVSGAINEVRASDLLKAPIASPSFTGNVIIGGDLAVNGGDITTSATTFGLLDSTATTVNAFGGTTTLNIGYDGVNANTSNMATGVTSTGVTKSVNIGTNGAAGSTTLITLGSAAGTSTVTVQGNETISGDLSVNGGDLTTSATTFNLLNTTVNTANVLGASTNLNIGATTATSTHNIASGATISASTKTVNVGTSGLVGSTTNVNIGSTTGASTVNIQGNENVSGNLVVTGNLTVNGATTTVNSTTVTIDDPILTLGGDSAPTVDDSKDRGVEFKWHNGTVAKTGFFGFDDSTGKFSFIPDAVNTNEVFSGASGVITASSFEGGWGGTTIPTSKGGTGLTSFVNNGAVYANSTSTLTTGTLPVLSGGTGVTTSTGSGNNVLSNSPTLVTPVLGVATGTSFNSITGLASVVSPMDGASSVGTSTTVARQDHVHASDTTKANIAQTMYVGTTALAINRASASQSLTGITSIDGSASKWTTARNIALTGSVTGNVNIDGSGNVSIATTTNHIHPQSQISDDDNHQIERTIQVKCASTSAAAIPSTLAVIDGYTPVVGDLVLLSHATASALQGVYVVAASGTTWTRYSLYSTEAHVVDRFVKVLNGTTYKNTYWTCVNKGAITVGTTALKIQQQFGDKTGAGLSMNTQGVLSVTSSPILTTARTIGILTGDITSAGSTFNGSANNTNSTTISNNVVTNAKLAQAPAMTIKGNNTVATANALDLTVGQVQTMIQDTTHRMVTDAQITTWNSGVGGGIPATVRTEVNAYTVQIGDYIVMCNFTVEKNITLPSPTSGNIFVIKSIGVGAVNIVTSLDGVANSKLQQGGSMMVASNGTGYYVISSSGFGI